MPPWASTGRTASGSFPPPFQGSSRVGVYPGFRRRLHAGLYSCRRFAAAAVAGFSGYIVVHGTLEGGFSEEAVSMNTRQS